MKLATLLLEKHKRKEKSNKGRNNVLTQIGSFPNICPASSKLVKQRVTNFTYQQHHYFLELRQTELPGKFLYNAAAASYTFHIV